MANIFQPTPVIVQQMLDDFKTVTGVTLDPSQLDDDNVIKAWTYSGAISALYSQIQRLANDVFAFSASTTALQNMLRARSLSPQAAAAPTHMQIQFTFSASASIPANSTQVSRTSDGAIYTVIQAGSGSSGNPATLYVEAVTSGSAGNEDQLNQAFTLITPIEGVNTACQNVSLGQDGRDIESNASMAARILVNDQNQNSGGNLLAYEDWAEAASNEVVSAKAISGVRGPGTVDVVITAGTTDIAYAVENNQSIVRTPSADLVATVQAYIETQNPVTDDVLVYGPTTTPLNVTFNFSLYVEATANRSYVNGQINQIIEIYLYSANPTDILTPSAIERLVDQAVGSYIKERSCANLGGSSTSFTVPNSNVIIPGTITLGKM